jgi:hypothetical protein
LSLALFALGGDDMTGGFCLGTLSSSRPMAIEGPILDTVVITYAIIVGASFEELGRCVNVGLLHLVRVHRFASLVVTPWGYKSRRSPYWTLHPLTRTSVASSPPSSCLKRERKREREREREGERGGGRERKHRGNFWGLESFASPSLTNYGRIRLDPF